MNPKLLGIVLLSLLATSIFSVVNSPKQALAAAPASATADQFINIDLSVYGPDNVNNDFPYGITCDDADNVYVTLFHQGRLVKIDMDTKEVLASYNDPEGPSAVGQGFYSIASDPNTGDLFINEVATGKVWRFNTVTEAWTAIPIVEEITGNPDVTYPQTFQSKPNLIRI